MSALTYLGLIMVEVITTTKPPVPVIPAVLEISVIVFEIFEQNTVNAN